MKQDVSLWTIMQYYGTLYYHGTQYSGPIMEHAVVF